MLTPKGNTVRVGFRPRTPATSQLVRRYLDCVRRVAFIWDPPMDVLDSETQDLKRGLTETDLICIMKKIGGFDEFAICASHKINEIWNQIDVRIYSGSSCEPFNVTTPKHLGLHIAVPILKQYLRT
jgi:hypothetical protein